MRSGAAFERPTWERPISASGSSSWPTPTTAPDAKNLGSNQKSSPASLGEAARALDWPTPRAGIQRASRRAMVEIDQWASPGLEQVAELVVGDLPREFTTPAEIPGSYRTLWTTPTAADGTGGPHNATTTAERRARNKGGCSSLRDDVAQSWPPELQALDDWPTPSATRYGSSQNGINGKGGENERPSAGTPSLDTIAARLWPTPSATDHKGSSAPGQRYGQLSEAAEQLWPTPTLGDSRAAGSRNAEGSKAHLGVSLSDAVHTGDSRGRRARETPTDGAPTSTAGRVLNPRFVEALMGWPPGWTDCASSETASSPTRPRSRSVCSGSGS